MLRAPAARGVGQSAGETPNSRSSSSNASDPSGKGVFCASRELLFNSAEDDGFTGDRSPPGPGSSGKTTSSESDMEMRYVKRNATVSIIFAMHDESAMTADSRREGAG